MPDITRRTFLDRQAAPPIDAPFLNDLENQVYYAQRRPTLILKRASAFSVPNGNWFTIPFEQASSAVLNVPAGSPGMDWTNRPSRLIIPERGIWVIVGQVSWQIVAAGVRGAALYKNGTQAEAAAAAGGTFLGRQSGTYSAVLGFADEESVSAIDVFAAGDWVQLVAIHTSGAPLGLQTDVGYTPRLSAVRISSDVA